MITDHNNCSYLPSHSPCSLLNLTVMCIDVVRMNIVNVTAACFLFEGNPVPAMQQWIKWRAMLKFFSSAVRNVLASLFWYYGFQL